jgi:hypothetical protein
MDRPLGTISRAAMLNAVLLAVALLHCWPAGASITRIVVSQSSPWPSEDKEYGQIGRYQRIQGLAYGELDPADPLNAIIQDIALAPRNARGRVEYVSTFTLYVPLNMEKWSGTLQYGVVNRGGPIVPTTFETGDAFLENGWQGDIPMGELGSGGAAKETIQVPIAKGPNGASITGPILARFINLPPGTVTIPIRSAIGYSQSGPAPLPVDLDTSHAKLTTKTFESVTGVSSPVTTVASGDWAWGDCSDKPFPGNPSAAMICLRHGADPALLYQLEYTGKDPLVLGIGLAAIRDVSSFFRYAGADTTGWKNPLAAAGRKNVIAIATGASQSGNLLRTFLNLGFNQDEDRKQVFDGIMPTIAGRQNPLNYRFAIPGGAGSVQELGSEGVVWWADWPDPARKQPTAGLLTRCTASRTCPKIVEVLGSSEFWSLRAFPDFVGVNSKKDIPLPPNVRRYYIASTQHGGGEGGFHYSPDVRGPRVPPPPVPAAASVRRPPVQQGFTAGAACLLPTNPNPERDIDRALLVALKLWLVSGKEPPPSVYPTLAAGTLVPADAHSLGFPLAPMLPSPDAIANPLLVYDLGDRFRANDLSGIVTYRPSAIKLVVPATVPRVDADGNEVGGIHTVLQQAALGTYLGWNVTASGFNKGQYCSFQGSYVPFAKTKAERLATADTRLSLEERYGSQRGYACVAKRAAEDLQKRGLLLPEDAKATIEQAALSAVLPEDASVNDMDRKIADNVCKGSHP